MASFNAAVYLFTLPFGLPTCLRSSCPASKGLPLVRFTLFDALAILDSLWLDVIAEIVLRAATMPMRALFHPCVSFQSAFA